MKNPCERNHYTTKNLNHKGGFGLTVSGLGLNHLGLHHILTNWTPIQIRKPLIILNSIFSFDTSKYDYTPRKI